MHHSIHTREVERNDDYDGEPEQKKVASLPRLGHAGIGRGADKVDVWREKCCTGHVKVLTSSSQTFSFFVFVFVFYHLLNWK